MLQQSKKFKKDIPPHSQTNTVIKIKKGTQENYKGAAMDQWLDNWDCNLQVLVFKPVKVIGGDKKNIQF